jgi:hypothetical protein
MTAQQSASLSAVCPCLPVGLNYVGPVFVTGGAVDDAAGLCDATRQANRPAHRQEGWALGRSPVKSRASGEPCACQAVLQTSSMDKSTKSGWLPCGHGVKLGAMARPSHSPGGARANRAKAGTDFHHLPIAGTVQCVPAKLRSQVVSFLLPVPGWLPWFCLSSVLCPIPHFPKTRTAAPR